MSSSSSKALAIQKKTKTKTVKAKDLKLKDLDPAVLEVIIVDSFYELKEKKKETKEDEEWVEQWEMERGVQHQQLRELLEKKETLRFRRSCWYLAHFLRMKFPRQCENTTSMDFAVTFIQADKEQHPLFLEWRERRKTGLDAAEFEKETGLQAWRAYVNGGKWI